MIGPDVAAPAGNGRLRRVYGFTRQGKVPTWRAETSKTGRISGPGNKEGGVHIRRHLLVQGVRYMPSGMPSSAKSGQS